MAEREGFEPSIRYKRIHTFQACAFDHSATSPNSVCAHLLRAHYAAHPVLCLFEVALRRCKGVPDTFVDHSATSPNSVCAHLLRAHYAAHPVLCLFEVALRRCEGVPDTFVDHSATSRSSVSGSYVQQLLYAD